MINHTTELTEALEQIGKLTFDVGCMKTEKELAVMRLNGFEKWLESQSLKRSFNESSDVLDVFRQMVRNEFK
jgi:AAA+ ATPase superfamily predicted ATPase